MREHWDDKPFEDAVLRLNVTALSLVFGIVGGASLFLATMWLALKGGAIVGPHLGLLGQAFIGYTVTLEGSVVGFAYGIGSGMVVGASIAVLYNAIVRLKARRRIAHASS